jgi:hypothetical protein
MINTSINTITAAARELIPSSRNISIVNLIAIAINSVANNIGMSIIVVSGKSGPDIVYIMIYAL